MLAFFPEIHNSDLRFSRISRSLNDIDIVYFSLQYPVFRILHLFYIFCREVYNNPLPCKRKQWFQYIIVKIPGHLFHFVQKKCFRHIWVMDKGESVFADPVKQTAKSVPQPLRDLMLGFEAGQPTTRLQTGSWHDLRAAAAPLRTEVFVQEQGVPQDMEWDDADHTAVHAVVFNHLNQAVATGRLLQHAPGVARIGRMAVSRVLRGGSLGRQVLVALMQAAAARGDARVMLHAQCTAQGFYERLGYRVHGNVYQEAGIAHIEMWADLKA